MDTIKGASFPRPPKLCQSRSSLSSNENSEAITDAARVRATTSQDSSSSAQEQEGQDRAAASGTNERHKVQAFKGRPDNAIKQRTVSNDITSIGVKVCKKEVYIEAYGQEELGRKGTE